jgi:hypothetical protein
LSVLNGAAFGPVPPILNPTKYASPSGKFVCEVDPSDLYGRGEGNYRITRDGELVWQGAKPFTLYEAGITDDGIVAGYAYTHGLEGFSRRSSSAGEGMFHTILMRSNGELILNEAVMRKASRFLHELPNPCAKGLLVDATNDLFVVRLSNPDPNRRAEILQGYRLSTGRAITVPDAALQSPTARSDFRLPRGDEGKPPELASFPDRPLRLLGTFSLQENGGSNAPAVRDVICFDLDDTGRIGFIRRESDRKCTFVQVSPEGILPAEVNLVIPAEALAYASLKSAWVKGDRWVVTASDCSVGGKAFAWWVDVASQEATAIPGFISPPIENVSGSRDGGFVVLATIRLKYSMEDELIAFDGHGSVRWRLKEDHRGEAGSLFSPEDLTVTTSGEIAIVDNIRKKVQLFGGSGVFVKTLDLAKIWGRKPNYPSEIAADNAGGILIRDFQGTPPLVRMDANGKVTRQFTPKLTSGRIIDTARGVRVSATGDVWVSDGDCIFRLAANGTADLVLGNAPKETVLGDAAAITVDQHARLYAVDKRSAAVHVFDENGSRLHVCKPDVADFSANLYTPELSATYDGEVYLSEGVGTSSGKPSFIHFGMDGRRIGTRRFDLDEISQKLYALPKGGHLLVGYQDAFLLDANARPRRTIQRRPDRNWLGRPELASVAPDGSFAIVTGGLFGKESWQVHLYSASGDPLRSVDMPPACLGYGFAFTGKHLVTTSASGIFLLATNGAPLQKFTPGMDQFAEGYWRSFATREGRELWVASAQRKLVQRFELP